MWVTRLSPVDWDFSKTQILLVTLRTQNQLRAEFLCVYGKLLFRFVGCARSRRQYLTVLTNQELFHWMLDCGWTDYMLLICGVTFVKQYQKHQLTPQQETVREITNPTPNKRESEMCSNSRMWTTSPQRHSCQGESLSCTF